MKLLLIPIFGIALVHVPLSAQVTIFPAPNAPVVEVVTSGVQVFDPVAARRQLAAPPQVVTAPELPGGVAVVPSEQPVETTRTTTVIRTEGRPTRVYNTQRNVVIIQDQGQNRELPYVTLPVLFVKETAELLDSESRTALEQVAGVILAITKTEPNSVFDIEGHTSTDGTDEFNMQLSAARAKRVFDELTIRYGVPSTVLSAHGYGESFPTFPSGTEEQMQMDRRVLVVRTK